MSDKDITEKSLKKSQTRRSPTTGHRRKKVDIIRKKTPPTPVDSSDEEIIIEKSQLIETPKKTLRKRMIKPKEVENIENETNQMKEDDLVVVDKEMMVVDNDLVLNSSGSGIDDSVEIVEAEPKTLLVDNWWSKWLPTWSRKKYEVQPNIEETSIVEDPDLNSEFAVLVTQTERKLVAELESQMIKDQQPQSTLDTENLEKSKEPTVSSFIQFIRDTRIKFKQYKSDYPQEVETLIKLRNRCISELLIMLIFCGLGGFLFKFVEGAFESFYKCGVKRVKRDFIDELWRGSHYLKEDEWKSKARRKLMEFENQLHEAFEAGTTTYSGRKSWSFINAVIYCLTVITTIGYGHIAPVTTTGRALTIAYSIIGIPLFLILLADFGKLFTRGIKFLWAFVRRLYYTGSCRKVRRTAPVQEMMKGVQMVYDMALLRRPSQMDVNKEGTCEEGGKQQQQTPQQLPQQVTTPMTGEAPSTPALSAFAVDDEFNLPITVAIIILLVYIFMGATVFYIWETDWTFFDAFYFVFISMSTIGFGDLVPANQMYMMASIVYLAFGLALTSMCINVVQEKLSDTFRQASAKIGATIGLKVCEDDGTVEPVSPTHVEIAEVHRPS